MRRLGLLALAALPALAHAEPEVSYLEGRAELRSGADGEWSAVTKGARVAEGATLRTGPKTRLELSFDDGSKVRLGSDARMTVSAARFDGQQRKSVSLRLFIGQVWANVAKAVSADSQFEVRTDNAVGGVRGTSFAVLAAADTSAIVRVYAGSVGVRPAIGETADRKRVPGPQQIDKKQWEEIIATAMKQVRISKLGELSPAEDFSGGDEFEQWNRKRDAKP